MKNSNLRNRIIAGISAGAIFVGGALSSTLLFLKRGTELSKSQKPYEYVMDDIENFEADPDILYNLSHPIEFSKPIRLHINEDRPVVVQCDKSLNEAQTRAVEKVIDYYNMIFESINENYKFVIGDEEVDVNKDDVVIKIENIDIKEDFGEKYRNTSGVYSGKKYSITDKGDIFVTKAKIYLDWIMCQEDENIAYATLLHEFGHALGLGDVYYEGDFKVCDYLDRTTFMSGYRDRNINVLYPNDYALLQALYSNEYKKHDNYQDSVDVVNKKIETYSNNFYKYYIEKMKEKYSITDKLKDIEFSGELYCFTLGKEYFLKILDKNKCEITVRKFSGEESKCVADIIYIDGVLFLKNITLEGIDSSNLLEKGIWSIYADEEGNIMVNDGGNMWSANVVNSLIKSTR